MTDPLAWRRNARCASYQTEPGEKWPWDTDRLRGKRAVSIMANREEIAKGICSGCPVRDRCLTEGLMNDVSTDMPDGIWGGKTPEERVPMIGKRIKWISGMRRLAVPGQEGRKKRA